MARTCDHVRANGTLCGSPALKNADYCYFHAAQRERRLRIQANHPATQPFQLPLLEDADAIQIAVMDVANALLADRIDCRKASLLLYALQTATANVKNLDFEFSGDGEHFIEYRTDHYDDHDNLAALDATESAALPDPQPAASEPSPSVGKRA